MVYDPRQDPKFNRDKVFQALINQESRFNPNARSPVGARGYTQVMPATASDPGFGLKANPNALTDPQQNVQFGYDYFNKMRERYNGNDKAALVAYNGGPGTADKFVASGFNDKVIPAESRNYYKTILGSVGNDFSKIKAGTMKADVETSLPEIAVTGDGGGKISSKMSDRLSSDESSSISAPVSSADNAFGTESSLSAVSGEQPKIRRSGGSKASGEGPSTFDVSANFKQAPKLRLDSFENEFRFRPILMPTDLDNPMER